MDFWEIFLTVFLILMCAVYISAVIYIIRLFWFLENDEERGKPKGYKLKKARERSINKVNDRKVKECIKRIKTAYKNGDRYEEISRFDSSLGWSKHDANYIHNAVYKWLDDNGIKYYTVTNVYDITIYFDKEEK